jgi:hypothetical protein
LQYPYSYQNNITEHYKMIPVYWSRLQSLPR